MTDMVHSGPQEACVPSASGSAVTAHYGDPCVYCRVEHDDIASGPCPARVGNVVGARVNYTMTQADLDGIMAVINAARGTPLIALQCGMPESPQEAANRAWAALGKRLGFDAMTVRPTGQGNRDFTAIATEAS